MRLFLILVAVFFSVLSSGAYACGQSSNCSVADDRHYRIKLPDGVSKNKKLGAIFFAHGLGGSATGIVNNENLIRIANSLGVALVALKAKRNDWNVRNSPNGRSDRSSDEYDYLDHVISDITKRFPINKRKLMLAGVSVGGTFTWTMACTGRGRFKAYMPISGTYWKLPPKSCTSRPSNIIHVHGTADKTVPLEGRIVGSSAHSDVREVIGAYSKIGGYRLAGKSKPNNLRCTNRRNKSGKILEFCLHGGGHSFQARHIEYAWRRFSAEGVL